MCRATLLGRFLYSSRYEIEEMFFAGSRLLRFHELGREQRSGGRLLFFASLSTAGFSVGETMACSRVLPGLFVGRNF